MRSIDELKTAIDRLWERATSEPPPEISEILAELRERLQQGTVRAAEPREGGWHVNVWVKRGLLLGFRHGRMREYRDEGTSFFDKDTLPPRRLTMDDAVRIVPGGSAIRAGAYVAPGVVCMPPMYVNVGAFVDEGTMLDSHVLVGSCAQIGKRVHLSAGAQIGGVLEPPGALPVVIEDGVFVGANGAVLEGTIVHEGAVLAAGTVLTRATPVYDLAQRTILRADDTHPLTIPAGAVVVPGSRPAGGAFASQHALHMYAPIIVKYRDARTDESVLTEDALHG